MTAGVLVLCAAACTRGEPPGAGITPAANTAAAAPASSSPAPRAESPAPPSSSSSPTATAPSGTPAASASAEAALADTAIDWENKTQPPATSPELEQSARALFDAIATDDPAKAKDFFFPREPFTPLKDVKDPDKYWRGLFHTYELDINKLNRKRRDWSGATFESFELGSPPRWVKPGDEYNKIGYYRTFGGMLRYRVAGTRYTIKVHTLISWNGRWTITHLLPFK